MSIYMTTCGPLTGGSLLILVCCLSDLIKINDSILHCLSKSSSSIIVLCLSRCFFLALLSALILFSSAFLSLSAICSISWNWFRTCELVCVEDSNELARLGMFRALGFPRCSIAGIILVLLSGLRKLLWYAKAFTNVSMKLLPLVLLLPSWVLFLASSLLQKVAICLHLASIIPKLVLDCGCIPK